MDIDSDNLPEILFWSNGGAHHVDLSIYKIKNNRLNKIFKIGSACGINVTPKSNPLRIKVGIPKFDKPGWSYADEPDWEMWIWNGKRFSKETTVITNYNKNK